MILYLQPCGTVSCSDQRSTDFAGMIDSSLKNYSRITLAHYGHCRSEASSAIKDTKSEAYYPPNQAAVPLYLKSLKSIDIKMLTYKLVLLVVPLGLSC